MDDEQWTGFTGLTGIREEASIYFLLPLLLNLDNPVNPVYF
jgi:hypothetical protein